MVLLPDSSSPKKYAILNIGLRGKRDFVPSVLIFSKENSVNNSFNNDEERGTQKKDTVITQNNVSNLKVVSPENQNVEDVEDDEKKKNNNLQNQKEPFQKTPIKLTKDVIKAIDKDKSNIDNNNKDNNNNISVTNEKDKDKSQV